MAEDKAKLSKEDIYKLTKDTSSAVAMTSPELILPAARKQFYDVADKNLLPLLDMNVGISQQYMATMAMHQQQETAYKEQQQQIEEQPDSIKKEDILKNPGKFQQNTYAENIVSGLQGAIQSFYKEREETLKNTPTRSLLDFYTDSGKKEIQGASEQLLKKLKSQYKKIGDLDTTNKESIEYLTKQAMGQIESRYIESGRLGVVEFETARQLGNISSRLEEMTKTKD